VLAEAVQLSMRLGGVPNAHALVSEKTRGRCMCELEFAKEFPNYGGMSPLQVTGYSARMSYRGRRPAVGSDWWDHAPPLTC